MKWRTPALVATGAIAAAIALLARLGSLAPRLSPTEQSTLAASANLHGILTNPTDLPLKLLQWLTTFAPGGHAVFFARLPSVVLALLALAIFTYLLHRWYGPRSTLLGFCIFVCSAWFLHIGRFAGPDAEYLLAVVSILAVHVGLYDHDDRPLMLYGWVLVNLLLLFIPGFVWFVLLGIWWQRAALMRAWSKLATHWNQVGVAAVAVAGLGAIAYCIVRTPNLWRRWAGLPAHLAPWQALAKNLAGTLTSFVYHGPHNPELWLGRLSLFDAFLSVMLLAGILFYAHHWRSARTRLLLSYLLLGAVLVALGGAVRLSVIVPIGYLVAIAGIAYVLHAWLHTFPRNPLARAAGISLVAVVIVLSCFYNLRQYFVAWPHNPDVAAIYQPK